MNKTINAKVFYNEQMKVYFMLRDSRLQCSRCTKPLREYAVVVQSQSVLEPMKVEMLCNGCLSEGLSNHGITMVVTCLIVSEIPEGFFQIHFSPITLINSNMDNMTLAHTNIDGEKIIDMTKHCHNPDFMKMPEYDPNHVAKIIHRVKELDRPMNEPSDVNDFFKQVKNAKPYDTFILDEAEKKKIEAKKR